MSNLVPVPVTDKNGVQAIRWKRPESTSMTPTVIPPVKTVSKHSHWDALRKDFRPVSKYLLNTMAATVKAMYRRENMVSQLASDTLDILNDHYSHNQTKIKGFIDECTRTDSLISLNNAAALIDCANDPVFNQTNPLEKSDYLDCVAGLRKYDGCDDIDYSLLDDRERYTAKALMRAAGALGEGYVVLNVWKNESPQHLTSTSLASLIRRRPESTDAIIDLLKDRKLPVETPSHIEAIEEILDGIQTISLRDGVL